ncbi:MAG: ABC transporter substrate-binding protein [Chloroflexi bacterium]|nr:ABC transporter substrate-binding protein [Chloroflexota bacterium]
MDSITVATETNAASSLIFIAEEQNYFAANGLNATFKDYGSGLAAVDGMLRGEVDIGRAAEYVIVGKAFTKESIRTLGSIDRFQQHYIVGRKDRGIDTVSELKGKKIGVPLKTASEFYLGRFLDLHAININQVTIVDVAPERTIDVIANGDIDAVAVWQPYI